jgi:hypothetical protein
MTARSLHRYHLHQKNPKEVLEVVDHPAVG